MLCWTVVEYILRHINYLMYMHVMIQIGIWNGVRNELKLKVHPFEKHFWDTKIEKLKFQTKTTDFGSFMFFVFVFQSPLNVLLVGIFGFIVWLY